MWWYVLDSLHSLVSITMEMIMIIILYPINQYYSHEYIISCIHSHHLDSTIRQYKYNQCHSTIRMYEYNHSFISITIDIDLSLPFTFTSFASSWFNNHHPVSYWSHYHSTSISIHSLTRAYIHITLSTFKSEYSSLCVYVIQSAVIYILCVSLSSYYLLDTQPVESLSLCVCFLYLLLNWKYN